MLKTPARVYAKGIGEAVADRTINRKIFKDIHGGLTKVINLPRDDGSSLDHQVEQWAEINDFVVSDYEVLHGDDLNVEVKLSISARCVHETWEDVAKRVAIGNASLAPVDGESEREIMEDHLRRATILMSGRHLQHGDADQLNRPMEVFTNCATSPASFLTFYLLLNGSGVGRSYDNQMMAVDWIDMPTVVPILKSDHPDALSGEIEALTEEAARHMYVNSDIEYYLVPDSREGWAKAVEMIELMTFKGERHKVLLLDFSDVRCRGSKIKGMQNRLASGPGPIMTAIRNVAAVRDTAMEPWRASMYIDHYLAECVLVGGARRAARMSTKTWRDTDIFDFIEIKRQGFLYSSNNSVMVDEEFWGYVKSPVDSSISRHANKVLEAVTKASYYDQTGEPGLINQDKLKQDDSHFIEYYADGEIAGNSRYQLFEGTKKLTAQLTVRAMEMPSRMIVNPCGEIALSMLGGYCVIGDLVPYHANSIEDAKEAFRVMTRALIRTNTMEALYGKELRRTNRIGVSMTGIHEFAWKFFGYGWKDLVNEEKSQDFWYTLRQFGETVEIEAKAYSEKLGLEVPHTALTIKPAGTTSKLFGLSEGAHLPTMREYLRWVMYSSDSPLLDDFRENGYPIRELKVYKGTTIVGFPTRPEICKLGMGDKLVTASEATPEEQYEWLRLLEKYYIGSKMGNQVSYTLKYDAKVLSYEHFVKTLIDGQSTIRACSVMPMLDESESAYEYLPEQAVSKHEYERILEAIKRGDAKEDVDLAHVDCEGGACPVDFQKESVVVSATA